MDNTNDSQQSDSILTSIPATGVEGNTTIAAADSPQVRILRALDRVRPFLMVASGNVELVVFDESTGIVEVRLLGACQNCSMSLMTLRAGIERAIMHEAPEVVRVESVSLPNK